jgi:hypothetical protein
MPPPLLPAAGGRAVIGWPLTCSRGYPVATPCIGLSGVHPASPRSGLEPVLVSAGRSGR